ncbi:2-hydroxyglutaryl-CoA dehydratase [Myxococcota bacterium]|nr:2-hydroxyglutaryl-CoA dehydratase [Myxococcota bacterium]
MIVAGIDIGSLTAKAVLLQNGQVVASHIERVRTTTLLSAREVLDAVIAQAHISPTQIKHICATGYGRMSIPFVHSNISEISCHGMGTFFSNPSVRTIIDIGGQDCKVIVIDDTGMVDDFVMNDKCAAGTGRTLEIMAHTLGIDLEALGTFALKSRRPLPISNKCSIFMELEVMQFLYQGKKPQHIAHGITLSIAKRIAGLAGKITVKNNICISGGVSKNRAVVRDIEKEMGLTFVGLAHDPQVMGALGAALFAQKALSKAQGKTNDLRGI